MRSLPGRDHAERKSPARLNPRLWVLAFCLTLAACATRLPDVPPPVGGQHFSGRIQLKVAAHDGLAAQGLSALFDLQGTPAAGEWQLSSPLGTLMAQARWSPGKAELSTPEGQRQFADLHALSLQTLGEDLPLAALFAWLQGQPSRDWPFERLADGDTGANTPAPGFVQAGWRVSLARFSEGWIVAERVTGPSTLLRVQVLER